MVHLPQRLTLIALATVLAACSGAPGTDGGDGGEPRTVEVRMTDEFRFEPDEITVRAGETVRFNVINDGELVHEFLVGDEEAQARFAEEMAEDGMQHDSDAGVSVDPGQTETFEYTFAEASELLAGCHEPGHYEAGMVASITVGV